MRPLSANSVIAPAALGFLLLASVAAPPLVAQEQESDEVRYARLVRKGVDHFRRKEFEKAASLFREALQLKSEPGTWFNLGAAWFNAGRPENAETALREAVRLEDGRYPEAQRLLGRILFARQDWAGAARELAAGLSPGADADAWKLLAASYQRLEDDGNALRTLEMAVLADPHDTRLRASLAHALYRAGRFEASRVEFRAALRMDPANGSLYRYLGYALLALDRENEALDALETARRLGEEDASLLTTLADLYASRNMVREAARAYARILEKRRGTAEDWYRQGSFRLRAGEDEKARKDFLEALKVDPGHAPSRIALGEMDIGAGRLDEAARRFRSVLDDDPNAWQALAGLGDVAYRKEAYDEAAEAFEKALALAPGSGDLWKRLGHAAFSAGRYADAAKAYRRALEFNPGDREADAYLSVSESMLRKGR